MAMNPVFEEEMRKREVESQERIACALSEIAECASSVNIGDALRAIASQNYEG